MVFVSRALDGSELVDKGSGRLSLFLVVFQLLVLMPATGSVIDVKTDGSIQEALDLAMPGDVVQVPSGLYHQTIAVTKAVVLRGVDDGGGRPVIDAGGRASGIVLRGAGCTVEGLAVINSGSSELDAGIKVAAANVTLRQVWITQNRRGIMVQSAEGCKVLGCRITGNENGIFLYQARASEISDCVISRNSDGVTIWESEEGTLSRNRVNENQRYGIYLVSSTKNYLVGNVAENNSAGLYLVNSPGNAVLDNRFGNNTDRGVYLQKSGQNVFKLNQISGSPRNFDYYMDQETGAGREYQYLNNDIDSSNLVESRPILHLVQASDQNMDASPISGPIFCIRCQNLTIQNLRVEDDLRGVFLYQSRGCLLQNNTLRNNSLFGIEAYESSGNLFRQNNISRSPVGVYLESSAKNAVAANNVFDGGIGIALVASSNNSIFLNNLVYNKNASAYDDGPNQWDDGERGNFYDDFECMDPDRDGYCDAGRFIPGGRSEDRFPLTFPVRFN